MKKTLISTSKKIKAYNLALEFASKIIEIELSNLKKSKEQMKVEAEKLKYEIAKYAIMRRNK